MTKIMLVEDDNNLREIYEARLAAEGYDIVAAPDGEAALAIAAKERPSLVISDVMMPKISGFEMLDILRNTEALRDVKVIMLTALGQSEDHDRAGALGADRYLVKSQVTLEDIVKAAHELLEGPDPATATTPLATTTADGVASEQPFGTVTSSVPQMAIAPEPDLDLSSPTSNWGQTPAAPVEPIQVVSQPSLAVEPPPAVEPSSVSEPSPISPVAQTSQLDAVVEPSQPLEITPAPAPSPAPPPPPTAVSPAQDTTSFTATDDAAQTEDPKETDLRSQIDRFLVSAGGQPAPTAQVNRPAAQSSSFMALDSEPSDSFHSINSDEPPVDINLENGIGGQNLFAAPPADEADAEYDRDDASPDMGQLSIRELGPNVGDIPLSGDIQPLAVAVMPAPAPPPQPPEITPLAVAPAPVEVIEPVAVTTAPPQTAQPGLAITTAPPVVEPPITAPQPDSSPASFATVPLPISTEPVSDTTQATAFAAPNAEIIAPTEPLPADNQTTASQAFESMMAASPMIKAEPLLPPSAAWKKKEIASSKPVEASVAESSRPPAEAPAPETSSGLLMTAAPYAAQATDPADLPASSAQQIAPPDSDKHISHATSKRVIAPLPHPPKPDIHQLLSMEEAKMAASQANAYQQFSAASLPSVQPMASPNGAFDPNAIAL